jgi:dCTP diphosphatase
VSGDTQQLARVIAELRQFVRERNWEQFHDPKNLAMLLASEAGEVVAEFRWTPNSQADAFSQDPAVRHRVAHEIADTGIALLLLCDRIGIDLLEAIEEKLAINASNYPVEESNGRADRPTEQ